MRRLAASSARQSAADVRDQAAEVVARVKPRLRGVIHEYSFFAALVLGALLIARANNGREAAAVAIYAVGICGLFGVSALYHRVTWRPARAGLDAAPRPLDDLRLHRGLVHPVRAARARRDARRDDPLGRLGRRAGRVALSLLWVGAPKWVTALVYVALGMVAIVTVPDMWQALGWLPVAGVALGGLLYTVGAVIYATERPDPVPAVYGYTRCSTPL